MENNRMPLPPNVKSEVSENELSVEQHDMAVEAPPIVPKAAVKRKIKVRALRAGFIHQERKGENDLFEVMPSELGSWMECLDPVEQKKHVERLMLKKKKVNKSSDDDHKKELADA